MPNNRSVLAHGLRMTSVFDFEGTDAGARNLLATESQSQPGTYYFGCAPVRMRLVNDARVYLGGEDRSILSLTHPAALAAARTYWRAVMTTVFPCDSPNRVAPVLTRRQELVVEMLIDGMADEDVARAIGRSVRTVRAEVAAAMTACGASSRAALGFAYANLANRAYGDG